MGNFFKDIVIEKDPAARKKNLEALIAEKTPSEVLVLTILSIVSDDDVIRRMALERLDARNQEEGNTAARVAVLIESWKREGTMLLWPEPMEEAQKKRAAEIEGAYRARAPLSSAVRKDSQPLPATSPLSDERTGARSQDAGRHVVEKRFEGWEYQTVREIEDLCATLPLLSRGEAMVFFERACKLAKKDTKLVERQRGRVFESLSGVVSSSDRRDFTVTYDIAPQNPSYGILMLETYDDAIGVLFCVARVSESLFLTKGFTQGEKSAIKSLRNTAPGSASPGTTSVPASSASDKPREQGAEAPVRRKPWWRIW